MGSRHLLTTGSGCRGTTRVAGVVTIPGALAVAKFRALLGFVWRELLLRVRVLRVLRVNLTFITVLLLVIST